MKHQGIFKMIKQKKLSCVPHVLVKLEMVSHQNKWVSNYILTPVESTRMFDRTLQHLALNYYNSHTKTGKKLTPWCWSTYNRSKAYAMMLVKTYIFFPVHRDWIFVSITFRCWRTFCCFFEWRNLKIQMNLATSFCEIFSVWSCHFSPVNYTSVWGPKATNSLTFGNKISHIPTPILTVSQMPDFINPTRMQSHKLLILINKCM